MRSISKKYFSLGFSFSIGIFYGGSIHLIESLLPNLTGFPQYQLSSLQVLTLIIFFSLWLLFSMGLFKKSERPDFGIGFTCTCLTQVRLTPKLLRQIATLITIKKRSQHE